MPETNSVEDFNERFFALQEEARSYGISSLVCLNESDRLSNSDYRSVNYCGGLTVCIGLAQVALSRLMITSNECD